MKGDREEGREKGGGGGERERRGRVKEEVRRVNGAGRGGKGRRKGVHKERKGVHKERKGVHKERKGVHKERTVSKTAAPFLQRHTTLTIFLVCAYYSADNYDCHTAASLLSLQPINTTFSD